MKNIVHRRMEKIIEDQGPHDGHEIRFDQRLEKRKKQKVFTLSHWRIMVASAVVLTAGFLYINYQSNLKYSNPINVTRVDSTALEFEEVPEVLAAENFFQERAHFDYSSITEKDTVIEDFMRRMQELENEYAALEKVYKNNIKNENVIQGMIDNFQFSLRIIEQLKKYVEIQNFKKTKDHEQQTM